MLTAGEGRAAAARARRAFRSFPTGGVQQLTDLEAAVCQRRGRPLQVVEWPPLAGGSVCGVWLATEARDLVLHAPAASPLHAQQFILHELAHIVLDGTDDDACGEGWFARSVFTDAAEIAAELLADRFAALLRAKPGRTPFERVFG